MSKSQAWLVILFLCVVRTIQAQNIMVSDATYFRIASGTTVRVNDFQIENNGTVKLESDCDIDVSGNFINSGVFSAGAGSTAIFSSPDTQSLTGASVFSNLTKSDGGILSLNSSATVSTLTLTSGKIQLGSGDLTVEVINGASSSNYIVTDGTGSLKRTVGGSDRLFPVGPNGTRYNPLTINNAGVADVFAVRVQSIFDHLPLDTAAVVRRQWTIAETVPGGSSATVVLQWGVADEGSSFNRSNSLSIGRYDGAQWNPTPAVLGDLGGNVYSATASGFTGFSEFVVGSSNALPITLGSFTAQTNPNGPGVLLVWMTVTEVNNYGFYVERRLENEHEFSIISAFIPGAGTTTEPQYYSWVDSALTQMGLYHYRIRQQDLNGAVHYSWVESIEVTTLSVDDKGVPREFCVFQNYPNPFNPSTTIKFTVEKTGHAVVIVYNALGQEVVRLFDGLAEPGRYYNLELNGTGLGSGVYFYRVATSGRSAVHKMLLLK